MAAAQLPPETLQHIPVMRDGVLKALAPQDGEIIIDGTFGRGGHSRAILSAANCKVIGIDRDPEAIKTAESLATENTNFSYKKGGFANVLTTLEENSVDGVFFDLGVSSPQLDDAARGFSFRHDGPLDMRMSDEGQTAAELVNTASLDEITRIFRDYGEEKFARPAAKAVIAARDAKPFTTTKQLADVIRTVVFKKGKIDPATRCFQGLRIAVNDELGQLERGLDEALRVLKIGGRLVALSFHSLEDRIVKQFMRQHSGGLQVVSRYMPEVTTDKPALELIKTPKKPTAQEITENARARSVRLRASLKINEKINEVSR